jgi:hypothetical protein
VHEARDASALSPTRDHVDMIAMDQEKGIIRLRLPLSQCMSKNRTVYRTSQIMRLSSPVIWLRCTPAEQGDLLSAPVHRSRFGQN